jgi:hypothetical protein
LWLVFSNGGEVTRVADDGLRDTRVSQMSLQTVNAEYDKEIRLTVPVAFS